jgi:hypothetical protein
VDGIGPRRDHLGLERLLPLGEVHLLPHDPLQVLLEVDLVHEREPAVRERVDDQRPAVAHARRLHGIPPRVARVLDLDRAVRLRHDRDRVLREDGLAERDPLRGAELGPGQLVARREHFARPADPVGAADGDADGGIAEASAEPDLDGRGGGHLAHAEVRAEHPPGGAGMDDEDQPGGDDDAGAAGERCAGHGPSLSG